MFFPQGDTTLVALMMLTLLGMSAGSLGWLANYRRAVLCFIPPMLGLLVLALLWQRTGLTNVMAVLTLLYAAVTLRLGINQNKLLTEALHARYEKEDLAQRLAQQVRMVEHASLEKTRFFASASHDLRQPLHSLGLFGSAILARLKDTADEPLARNMMHCVDALEASFSAMLDVSKLDAGVVAAKPQPMAVAELFRRLDAKLGRQAQAQDLALRFKPAGKWVLADMALLERMLGNLVHNALKFTQRGGVVVVVRSHAAQLSIQVWDTGEGIAAQDLPRIFDEFYQVGNRERDRSMGLGMGLAIVRRLSGLMDIPVQVQSRVGRGTVFKLLVPSALALPQPAPALRFETSGTLRALAGLNILVVDDEENVRVSTAAALQLYGMQVQVAASMAQAVEIAQQLEKKPAGKGKLDALITDFRLRGDEDGIALAHMLRHTLGRPLPVLLVTGDTAPQRVRQAQASGLRVLYKPVKIHDLVEELRMQLL
jgi:signal transduction histidine kinase/ActR/RegA family two-component response regulator